MVSDLSQKLVPKKNVKFLREFIFVIQRSKYDLEVIDFSCWKLFRRNDKCSNFVQNLSFWGQYKMFGPTFDLIDPLGGPQGGAQSRKKFAEIQFCCVQAKTTGNTASKVINYLLVWLLRIW